MVKGFCRRLMASRTLCVLGGWVELETFWRGVLAGYGIAIPVGAIAILIVEGALRRGFGWGFAAGAGAATADFIYAGLAAVAGQALSLLLAPYAVLLRGSSAIVLLAIGGYGLWRLRQAPGATRAEGIGAAGRGRTYVQFLGLTLLNPLTIAYFASLILGMQAGTFNTPGSRLAFVVGAGLASLSWQSLLAAMGALGHRHLSPRFQFRASLLGNVLIVAFGVAIVGSLVRG